MSLATHFKSMFRGATLEIDDLLLLESFQIALLPGWVPEREFGVVLSVRPEIARFFVARCPDIAEFVDSMVRKHGADCAADEIEACGDTLVWTIADLLVYNKCPEVYDAQPFHGWDFAEITSIVDLMGKIVIDGGSGTGRVALEAAETAASVFAVEPVSRLRDFIRAEAAKNGLDNLFVVDGFVDRLPFPSSFADVVITSHALGWRLDKELREIERVARRPGVIIHCPGTAVGKEEDQHAALLGAPWHYDFSEYEEADGRKRKYWKNLPCNT
jgi:SAM-dependent methyltransferase